MKDTQDFIEKYYPNYSSSDEIAEEQDLFIHLEKNGFSIGDPKEGLWIHLHKKILDKAILGFIAEQPTIKNPLEGIDYKMLKEQKESLIRMIQDWGEADDENQKEDAEMCDGILHLIDDIQDYAVDSLGIKENIVFGIKS